ncbi:hypothetical protein [Simplicispira psychrophila]|uniref:hypothetical protein n=1 Tax=Simplicispira psychrophila TaxID=80882 RepID=UPI0004803851|nr:hypothetical protein [Simplicispira psychrophila]
MRKNLLALSIAAMVGGLSGAANAAVFVNTVGAAANGLPAISAAAPLATQLTSTTTGIGHILVVPYFSTQQNNNTLLNLVNTDTVNGKAVKLRFRGAANSDDVFDISIFLSPGDMWTANVSADGDLSRLATSDTSCTLPSAQDIKDLGGKFKTNRVRNADPLQTREGYVEILNMADVPPGTGTAGANSALYTAIKHVNGVAPCTQALMDLQENDLVAIDGDVNSPVRRGYSWPTGGLMANWVIVNVGDSASFSGEAVALRATPSGTIDTSGSGNLVWFPQTTATPTMAANLLTADPLLSSGAVIAASYDFPDLSTPYVSGALGASPAAQASELASTLAVRSVTNEYLTNKSVNFATDWVFSMPTRRYAAAYNYGATGSAQRVLNPLVSAHFNSDNVTLDAAKGQLCISTGTMRAFDREENTRTTFVISPASAVSFCGETSVLSFNSAAYSVLGAKIAQQNIETKFADGWFSINTPGVGNGLPVIGFAAAKTRGTNLGGTWKHRYSR